MDLEKLSSIQDKCINDNPPDCITECPIHVDVKAFIGEVRKENFELIKHEPNHDKSTFIFFPGCQLSASYSEEVVKTYVYLTEKLPGSVGLYLGCCGAAADCAGQSELFNSTMGRIEENLKKMRNPIVITACSTCFNNFSKGLKNIKIRSLWEIFLEEGIPEEAKKGDGETLVVHDACTTREEKEIYKSIRKIAENLGYKIEEPHCTKETTKCCGFGGLNKQFSRTVSNDRIKDSENDFLVYCVMCRDLLILNGKKSYHILDILFGNDKNEIFDMNVPTLSEKRANRLRMKKYMLETLWGEKMEINNEHIGGK